MEEWLISSANAQSVSPVQNGSVNIAKRISQSACGNRSFNESFVGAHGPWTCGSITTYTSLRRKQQAYHSDTYVGGLRHLQLTLSKMQHLACVGQKIGLQLMDLLRKNPEMITHALSHIGHPTAQRLDPTMTQRFKDTLIQAMQGCRRSSTRPA